MRHVMLLGTAVATLAIAACGQDAGVHGNEAGHGDHVMANDPANPFAEAEMGMYNRMAAAQGADVSDTWVRKMIEHHRGAVEMSNIVLSQTQNAGVRRIAQMTVDKQNSEIQELERMLRQDGSSSSEAAELYRAAEQEMHNSMMAATGTTIDETWMRKMIEHHRGGVAMSDIVLANNPDPQVREKAQRVRADQSKEISDLEAMLRGEDPAEASSVAPAPKTTPAPAAEPKATAAPKAAPKTEPTTAKVAPKPAAKAEPKAEPKAPVSDETCAPEHRAAGHC
jgi:uncharacterized protein (DUF305 family)